jgi:hypothetical protein
LLFLDHQKLTFCFISAAPVNNMLTDMDVKQEDNVMYEVNKQQGCSVKCEQQETLTSCYQQLYSDDLHTDVGVKEEPVDDVNTEHVCFFSYFTHHHHSRLYVRN